MSIKIKVSLRTNRTEGGQLAIYETIAGTRVFGPIPCMGKAADDDARDHGNDGAAATKAYGNTPTGDYDVVGSQGPEADAANRKRYGPQARLQLKGMVGEAMIRDAVSLGTLRIHGGDLDGQGKLRRTHGCIRVSNPDMVALLNYLSTNNVAYPIQLTVLTANDVPLIAISDNASFDAPGDK